MSIARKRVWYISKYFAVPQGEAQGSRGFELLRALATDGHDCVVFTSDSNHLTEVPEFYGRYHGQVIDGVTVVWIKTLKFRGVQSIRRILSWIHFEFMLLAIRGKAKQFGKPDAVVASSLSLFSVVSGYILSRRNSARFAFEVRDIWPLTITEEGGFSEWNPFVKALASLESFGYRKADVIIGTMPNLAEHVREVTGTKRPTVCIPMGVAERALGRATPLPADWLDAYLPKGKFIIGYAGTIGTTNALDSIFEAADQLATDERYHFVFVGAGGMLSQYTEEHGHKPNITFAPRIPKNSVDSFLRECDVLVLSTHPSKVWRFGQSLNKLIDYMLAEKPVVAAMDGHPSMLNEAGSGTFVPSDDGNALAESIKTYAGLSVAERVAIGQRGRTFLLENQSFESLAQRFAKCLFD